MRAKYFVSGLCLISGVLGSVVQAAPGDKTAKPKTEANAENAVVKPDTIGVGEIRLDGKITAMTAVDSFEMSAVSFTTQAGKVVEFDEPKRKVVAYDDTLRISPVDDPQRVAPRKEMKLSSRVAVIGRDGGSGKSLKARIVLLADFSARYSTGRTEQISAPVSMILGKGIELLNGRDYERASKVLQQALRMGEQMNDVRGQALSMSWLAAAYSELNQPQKALENMNAVLKIREALNDQYGIAMALSNRGMQLNRMEQLPEALKDLQRATTLFMGGAGDVEDQVHVLRNLARVYGASKQPSLALDTLQRALPLARTQGDPAIETSILIGIAAYAWESDKKDVAAASFKTALALYEKLPPGTPRVETLSRLGSYYRLTGDKVRAREMWTQAATEFEQLGDGSRAAETRRAIEALDKPDAQTPAPNAATSETAPAPAAETAPPPAP